MNTPLHILFFTSDLLFPSNSRICKTPSGSLCEIGKVSKGESDMHISPFIYINVIFRAALHNRIFGHDGNGNILYGI